MMLFDLSLGYKFDDKDNVPQDKDQQQFIADDNYIKDKYGWSLTETWDLDKTVCEFLLRRLYVFYKTDITLESKYDEGTFGYILEIILEGLLLVLKEYTNSKYVKKQFLYKEAKTKEAFMLLGKYAQRLWN
jgi:hypothetical protein